MIALNIKVNDAVTPTLKRLQSQLTDRTELNAKIAATAETLTRRYLIEVAAPVRHKTAERLGATPTGYLGRRANAIESRGTKDAAIVSLGSEADIFARVDGPVIVRARAAKFLTIPATAAAFGRRAREIGGLFPVTFKTGSKALVQKDGKKLKVFYWLKEAVTLPQDRELLPSDEGYEKAAELAAQDFVDALAGGDA